MEPSSPERRTEYMNYEVFLKGMSALCAVFDREPTDVLLGAYYSVLKGLTAEEFEIAVGNILTTCKFHKLPLPAEIIEAARGSNADRAVLALDKVEKAIREVGGYRTVMFDDPVIHAVIESMGGWVSICEMTSQEWKFARKDFLRLYEAFSRTNFDTHPPQQLPGRHDTENNARGINHKTKPVIIETRKKPGELNHELEPTTKKEVACIER